MKLGIAVLFACVKYAFPVNVEVVHESATGAVTTGEVPTGAGGAGGASGAAGAVTTVVDDALEPDVEEDDEEVVVEAGGLGITMLGGNAAPPFEATAMVLIAAKEAALVKVGSGFTLLTSVLSDEDTEVKEAAATFWLITELNCEVAEEIKAADAGKAPLLAAASDAKPLTVDNKEPLLDNSSEVRRPDNKAALGSVVVIFDVGLVNGAGAVSKLAVGGRPKDTATVALATDTAA